MSDDLVHRVAVALTKPYSYPYCYDDAVAAFIEVAAINVAEALQTAAGGPPDESWRRRDREGYAYNIAAALTKLEGKDI